MEQILSFNNENLVGKTIKGVYNDDDVRWLPYGVVEKLIEWNFDINGLIEDGLAIKMENN